MTRRRARRRTTREISDASRRILNSHLDPGEEVVAQGRADFLRHRGDVPQGSGHILLLVTSERIVWTGFGGRSPVASVPFESLKHVEEGMYQHRYVVALHHRPAVRLVCEPRHTFLWWTWGNAHVTRPRTETIFGFSRRDTVAARAIRDRIARLDVPVEQLALPRPLPREAGGTFLRTKSPRLAGIFRHRFVR